jgi:hypothetical protein
MNRSLFMFPSSLYFYHSILSYFSKSTTPTISYTTHDIYIKTLSPFHKDLFIPSFLFHSSIHFSPLKLSLYILSSLSHPLFLISNISHNSSRLATTLILLSYSLYLLSFLEDALIFPIEYCNLIIPYYYFLILLQQPHSILISLLYLFLLSKYA